MKYTFLSFLMLWHHRSHDQNGPKFNIRSKTLLEPFSKNIFKQSCSLMNNVLKNSHDYFFLKKCGSRKSNWKVCQLPGQWPFEVGIKENFAKGLRVCFLWLRCQFLLISIAFGEDRCLRFFWGEGLEESQKRGFTFARFLFTATPRHKRLARKKKFQGLDNGLDFFFLNETLDDFFNYFFYGCCVLRDNVYLRRQVDTDSCCCLLKNKQKNNTFVVHLNALPT